MPESHLVLVNNQDAPRSTSGVKVSVMEDFEKEKYFVLLNTEDGGCTPLKRCLDITTNEAELARFVTKEAATASAKNSGLGEKYGFEVLELG